MQYVLLLTLCVISLAGCSTVSRDPAAARNHYYDTEGQIEDQFDPLFHRFSQIFGPAMPSRIVIEVKKEKVSRILPNKNRILISAEKFETEPTAQIAHETTHLALNRLTNGVIRLDQFRFLDEGFAGILEQSLTGDLEQYKQQILPAAALEHRKVFVTLDRLQRWSSYYGTQYKPNPGALAAATSFSFFLLERYGEQTYLEFLASLAKTQNIDWSLSDVFHVTQPQIERDWHSFLMSIPVAAEPPRVVELNPRDRSADVPAAATDEIYATFDVPMNTQQIVVIANCEDGICYKNAYWKDAQTLAIRVSGKLKTDHRYQIQLGGQHRQLLSAAGIPLPVTEWSFVTQ